MSFKFLLLLLNLTLILSCNTKSNSKSEGKTEGSDGVSISYSSCGNGDTTLLFIHGWGINKEYWDPQLEYFCPRYKVVAIDLPGFGQSGKNRNDWNFNRYADDIHAIISHLKLKNVILLGHSMSGDIILSVDNKYPADVISIVGVDNLHEPGAPMNAEDQQQTDSFFSSLSQQFDSTVARSMTANLFQPTTDSSIRRRVMNDVFNSDSMIAVTVLRAMTVVYQQEKPMMQNLSHKLFLINSDVTPVKQDSLNKYCRRGWEVVPVHGTGHYPMIEKPGEFNAALEKVIRKVGIAK